jgi:hypothetical protein
MRVHSWPFLFSAQNKPKSLLPPEDDCVAQSVDWVRKNLSLT